MEESNTYSGSIFSRQRGPQNSRSYMNMSHPLQQTINTNDNGDSNPQPIGNMSSLYNTNNSNVIYGTNISSKQAYQSLEAFITDFEV